MLVNDQDYVELGLHCADICDTQPGNWWEETQRPGSFFMRCDKSVNNVGRTGSTPVSKPSVGRTLDPRTVAEIQRKISKNGGRNAVCRLFHLKIDKGTTAG